MNWLKKLLFNKELEMIEKTVNNVIDDYKVHMKTDNSKFLIEQIGFEIKNNINLILDIK